MGKQTGRPGAATGTGVPVLEVSHFTKSYGARAAVDDVSLVVRGGTIFGFIGPNGAGKTTLIRSIVGASTMTSGDIRICGMSVREQPVACKRLMAYVPDNPDVYGFLTGAQYLAHIADVFGVPREQRQRHIERYAQTFRIEGRLDELVSSYSHGMRQKLVLVSAFLHAPRLLVLDEPFVGLDPQASHELKTLMREFTQSGGAIFFSSHVLEVVERLCDEVAIIKEGRIVTSGATEEVCGDDSLEDVFLELADNDAADRAWRGGEGA